MKILIQLSLIAFLLAAPPIVHAGEAESSLDDVDRGRSKSLDEAEHGRSRSPDEAPRADSEEPEIAGPGEERIEEGRSLDEADTGRSRSPDSSE